MIDPSPDPMADPEGYALWCELHACRTCEGTGAIDDDNFERTCRACDGSGIDPEYFELTADEDW